MYMAPCVMVHIGHAVRLLEPGMHTLHRVGVVVNPASRVIDSWYRLMESCLSSNAGFFQVAIKLSLSWLMSHALLAAIIRLICDLIACVML